MGARAATAVDHVVYERDGVRHRVQGRVEVEAQDGGLLVMDRGGKLWTITAEEKQQHTTDEIPFAAHTPEEIGRTLLEELPDGFQVHTTAHYVILYDTSRSYARWCGTLLERLYGTFNNFWKRKGFELVEPELPMVAVVFAERENFRRYMQADIGRSSSIVGYYNLINNRVAMYDLTGVQRDRVAGQRERSRAEIDKILARPEAGMTVATIVHEATHQIAFNCGLQRRLADVPFWLSEGVAMYFETPNLASSGGWRGIGKINPSRLSRFRSYQSERGPDSLRELLRTDERLQNSEGVLEAYAESWALVHFLLKRYPDEFVEYMQMLSQKTPLVRSTPEERLEEFEQIFGNLDRLDREFVTQMRKLR
ncbi:MAG: DUF1570 domain-containing protein [Planctomycetota bacterium]|nr:MAG: DUF1570 domain-containing protein [Planctomycetota bacterium]